MRMKEGRAAEESQEQPQWPSRWMPGRLDVWMRGCFRMFGWFILVQGNADTRVLRQGKHKQKRNQLAENGHEMLQCFFFFHAVVTKIHASAEGNLLGLCFACPLSFN